MLGENTPPYPVPIAVYDALEKATPAERREIVLRLIAAHPKGRLELLEREERRAKRLGFVAGNRIRRS